MAGLGVVRQPRLNKGEVNPLDKSTIISIFPLEIHEIKHTIQPGTFHLEPGSYETPTVLVVGPSSWWRVIDLEQDPIEIPQGSVLVARSIVEDYCNGLVGCNMGNAMPGLSYVPGAFTLTEIRAKHKNLLDQLRDRQNNWFRVLISEGDKLWSRSNGNPSAIPDLFRLAARQLQVNREWVADFDTTAQQIVRCVACGQMRNPQFPICPHCKTIVDMDKFNKSGLKQAP